MDTLELKKNALKAAAISGLLGLSLNACGDKTEEKIVLVEKSRGALISKVKKEFTAASFTALCDEKKGLVQWHASCAGANSCAGLSYSHGTIIEHSCRAANTCAGMSCVYLPEDQGRSGESLLQQESLGDMDDGPYCTFCHGDGKTSFILPIAPGTNATEATTQFQAKPEKVLVSKIAFGIHGVNADGTAFANMPGFYQRYSVAEIQRMVSFLKTLPVETKEWTNPQ